MEENIISVAVSVVCCLCYYLGWRVSRTSNQDNNQLLRDINKNIASKNSLLEQHCEIYKRRAEVDSLRARYFRKVLKLHKINFVEHPTQEDLDNVLSEIELQKEAESNEHNEA